MEFAHSRVPQTLPEALLLLAHDPRTGRIKGGNWATRYRRVNALNRGLLTAGLLELILRGRIFPCEYATESNILLYRLAHDDDPLPTPYTTGLWNLLLPHVEYDLSCPFQRLIRLVQIDSRFGDGFHVPDQTRESAKGMGWQESQERFAWGAIPPFAEDSWALGVIETTLTGAVSSESGVQPDRRTIFLLGLLLACDQVQPFFGRSHQAAEARIRELCHFAKQPETPMGDAFAFVTCQDHAR